MEITIEPWKKLVIHEVIEYNFDDWVTQIAFGSKTGGGAIPSINWVNGIVFQSFNFPDTNIIVEEKLKGVLHWSSVMFAVKEKYEKQIIKDNATINLVDVSVNGIFKEAFRAAKKPLKVRKKLNLSCAGSLQLNF
ncbi:hypothetical protein QVH35_10060 [Candidatus Nitrosotenuis chungbukensis]|uniref:hypothetical protein n=1 Tax=Candidatus Nitrosotenuis chungbukensis TaxID=1353246 RepID=UPI0026727035|nr:hypothetical protein [Candidatus Nitrosotenuis chungbukensis]WKT57661.1 hypothetical protein QVH35_10060 [Candidatus Nitrosotenuis chungbukensis]